MSKLGEHLTGGWKKQLGTRKEFEAHQKKKEVARKMKVTKAHEKRVGHHAVSNLWRHSDSDRYPSQQDMD